MDIESIFAAEVFNAPKAAAEARKHGIPQTTSDQVSCALADLWQYDNTRADEISKKYVRYDKEGNPWPRDDIDWGGNVVAFA